MIRGRNPGDNISIMNTLFRRGKDEAGNFREFLYLVYKDCDSQQKFVEEIIDPDYKFYVAKPDKRVTYNRLFVSESDVDLVTVPHKELDKAIAKITGMTEYFYTNISTGNRNENRKLHLHPDIFNSDMNIEDHYRYRFDKLYRNETKPITKSFFDIEVDGINILGDFPEPGEAPINAVSLIIQETQQVYSFLLRTKTNPQIEEFENEVKNGTLISELERFIVDAVGGPEMAQKYNINFKYNFLFYDEDDEINLIKDIFSAINTFKPDFLLAWNMSFDIPYVIARIQRLGYDPCNIMCSPDFKHKFVYYYVDERNKNEIAERGDFASIASYTTFLDQMIHFASRRKGQNKFISFNLDYIGEAIAKVRKLDYKHITTDIAQLPYKDYKTFVFYNIMDTIVQYCIEFMTTDLEYVYNKSLMNNTRYSKVHRQTVYLMNRGIKEFKQDGFIMGNNVNKFNIKPDNKFPGAFVADPKQLNDYSRLRIYGRAIDVFDNCMDFDYASLYPSVIRQFNIAPHTQIGLLIINKPVHDKENKRMSDTWTRAGAFMEDFQSQVWLEVCSRWFHLADYTTMYHEVEHFFENIMRSNNGLKVYNRDGLKDPIIFYKPNMLYDPIVITKDDRRVVTDKYIKPDLEAWKEFRNAATINPNQLF